MKSCAFYLLLYFRPIVQALLTILCRVFGLLAVIMLIGIFFNDLWGRILLMATIFFVLSVSASVLQANFTKLLLKLQPDGTEYTFYD